MKLKTGCLGLLAGLSGLWLMAAGALAIDPGAQQDFIDQSLRVFNAVKAAKDQCGTDLTTPAGEYWCVRKDGSQILRMNSDTLAFDVMSQGGFNFLGYADDLGVCVSGGKETVLWCQYGKDNQFLGAITMSGR